MSKQCPIIIFSKFIPLENTKRLVFSYCFLLGSMVFLLLSSQHGFNRHTFVRPVTKKNSCNQMNCNNYAEVGKGRFIVVCTGNNTIINNTRINCVSPFKCKPTFAHPCIYSWILNSKSISDVNGKTVLVSFDVYCKSLTAPFLLPVDVRLEKVTEFLISNCSKEFKMVA